MEPLFPQASEPDTYVRGRLVSPDLARRVRIGWKTGVVYLVLKVLSTASLMYALSAVQTLPVLVYFAEIAAVAFAIYGVRQWNNIAAWMLFAIPIISAIMVIMQSPLGTTATTGTLIGFSFTVTICIIFGRAAMAIDAFNRASRS